MRPQEHYKSVGKYLRAVEKSILVTSTWDSYPPLTEKEKEPPLRTLTTTTGLSSAPATPLFSPIPFLHDDARRSKSRSPPPSPLVLSSAATNPDPLETRALGLVDELDDPSPGHMSVHPTALTSVTTIGDGAGSRPFIESLDQRFVRSQEETSSGRDETMDVDEDKENTKA